MTALPETFLNRYQYDPLDRLVRAHSIQRFYIGNRIATEIQGNRKICFLEHGVMPLAELEPGDEATLLAIDGNNTVIHSIKLGLIRHQLPIHNYASAGEWQVKLMPSQSHPAASRSALHPIFNYAAEDEWKIILAPGAIQNDARLIRTEV